MKRRSKVGGERAKVRSLKTVKLKRSSASDKARLAPLPPMLVRKEN